MNEVILPAIISVICTLATIIASNYFGLIKSSAEKRHDARLQEMIRIRNDLENIVQEINNRWSSPDGRGILLEGILDNFNKSQDIFNRRRSLFIADKSVILIQDRLEKALRFYDTILESSRNGVTEINYRSSEEGLAFFAFSNTVLIEARKSLDKAQSNINKYIGL